MKRIGAILLALGILITSLSALLFGGSIYRAFESREVAAIAIEPGDQVRSDSISVDHDRLVQVSIALDVHSESVQEETRFDEREYKLRYQFPLQIEVRDEQGALLHRESVTVAWDNGFRTTGSSHVTAQGGRMQVRHHFGKFNPPTAGGLIVEAQLEEDTVYGARAEAAQVIVYDNVSRQGPWIAGGVAACCAGPTLMLVGLILLIMGLASGGRQPASPM